MVRHLYAVDVQRLNAIEKQFEESGLRLDVVVEWKEGPYEWVWRAPEMEIKIVRLLTNSDYWYGKATGKTSLSTINTGYFRLGTHDVKMAKKEALNTLRAILKTEDWNKKNEN